LKLGPGQLIIHILDRVDLKMSAARSCCGRAYPELEPILFSFNAPQGMCPDCNGIGTQLTMDVDKLVSDKTLSIREGAVLPYRNYFLRPGSESNSWGGRQLAAIEKQLGVDFDRPWNKLTKRDRDIVLYGSQGREVLVRWNSEKIQGQFQVAWEGLINTMMRRYLQTQSESQKQYYRASCPALPDRKAASPEVSARLRSLHHRCHRDDHRRAHESPDGLIFGQPS
jgi:excinuclease ABC subunit A